MIGFYAAGAMGQGVTPTVSRLIFPLTYDEQDSESAITLTRGGGAGPHVTPDGFEGDGYEARYTTTDLPPWVNSGEVSLQASISVPALKARSTRDELVSLCTDDASADVRLGFSVRVDGKGDTLVPNGAVMLAAGAGGEQTVFMGRPGWKYQLRTPNPTIGSTTAKPQGIHFVDSTTMIFSVHLDDTESIVYRVNLADNSITGQFSFGPTTHRHIASIAERSNGDVWMGDYETGLLLQVDLDASFSSGAAVILATCTPSGISGVGAIAFANVNGSNYLLLQQYDTLDPNTYLLMFPEAVLDSASFTASDRYKRFLLGRRIQGLCIRDGNLLVSRNNVYGASSPAGVVGWVQEFDIDGMAASLADGSSVHAGSNASYLLQQAVGPASYVEDMAVHPTTNDVFMPTEGGYGVADYPGFLGVWSSSLTEAAETNHYAAEWNGSDTVTAKVNGYTFATLAWTLDQAAAVLTIGGLPAAIGGFTTGHAIGTIANVALVNGAIDSTLYQDIISGSYEPNSLDVYTITLTNPGAESGNTTGWTVESGGMAVRDVSPAPYAGSYYFSGGSFASSVSRQRVTISSVPAADIDTGKAWAKIRWQQSAYSDQDPGSMGVRTLTSGDATLATSYAPSDWTPFGGGSGGPWHWYPRCYPVGLAATTRKIDALYNASGRTSGTNNDFFVDAVSVVVYVQ